VPDHRRAEALEIRRVTKRLALPSGSGIPGARSGIPWIDQISIATRKIDHARGVEARLVPVADRRALAIDRPRNAALHEAIQAGAPIELYAAEDGTLLAVDPHRVARLSDPATLEGARALAAFAPTTLAMARGPVGAIDAFVAQLTTVTWARLFEGIEMVWTEPPALRAVAGEMRCSTALDRSFADWRASFIAEAFRTGGSPPPVAPDQLFVWVTAAGPHAMAGLIPQGPTGARILTVYTPPAERGRGYASALTAALAEHARARGQLATLDVSVADPYARRAYERAGFRAVGRNAVWWRT